MPAAQMATCTAWGCHFGSGDASWVCDTVVCDCPDGCAADGQDYAQTFKNVKGEVTLDCDEKTSVCLLNVSFLGRCCLHGGDLRKRKRRKRRSLVLLCACLTHHRTPVTTYPTNPTQPTNQSNQVGSLDIKLEANCEASECIDPQGPILVGERRPRPKGREWVNPVVSAVPAMVLFAGIVACGAMMAGALPYLRPGKAGAAVAGGGSSKAAGPVGEGREGGSGRGDAAAKAADPEAGSSDGAGGGVALPIAEFARRPVQELAWSDLVVRTRLARTPVVGAARELAEKAWAAARRGRGARGGGAAAAGPAGVEMASTATGGAAAPVVVIGAAGQGAEKDAAAALKPAVAAGSNSSGQRWKTILHGVSGAVRAREVTGVLGPSGSGKSTLLSSLSGSLSSDSSWRVRGHVTLDGAPATAKALAKVTALVPQDDLLLRSLTVEECLLYSAALRLPPALPPAAVHARVEEVMAALKITRIRGSTVWSGTGAAAGVSGGERRRVAIGMELVTDPQVLVLDEPTSGLDSFTALNLLRTLRGVAARGRAVMLSLHQPSPVLFDAMDQVILMADGTVIYQGAPSAAGAGMGRLGAPLPAGVSVAEHMLHVVSDPETHARIVARAAEARAKGGAAPPPSAAGDSAGDLLLAGGNGDGAAPSAAEGEGQGRRRGCWPLQRKPGGRSLRREVGVLFWRSLADMLRNPMLTAFHAVGGLVLGLLVGVIFYQVALDTTGAQNRLGAVFFGLALMAFTSVTSVDLVQAERNAA
jgi:ABC-type multidrug transport system ATPase subunit